MDFPSGSSSSAATRTNSASVLASSSLAGPRAFRLAVRALAIRVGSGSGDALAATSSDLATSVARRPRRDLSTASVLVGRRRFLGPGLDRAGRGWDDTYGYLVASGHRAGWSSSLLAGAMGPARDASRCRDGGSGRLRLSEQARGLVLAGKPRSASADDADWCSRTTRLSRISKTVTGPDTPAKYGRTYTGDSVGA